MKLHDDVQGTPDIGHLIFEDSSREWEQSSDDLRGVVEVPQVRPPTEDEGTYHGHSYLHQLR